MKNASLPWPVIRGISLIGLRNVISHCHETIDHAKIWRMITDELPALSKSLNMFTDS